MRKEKMMCSLSHRAEGPYRGMCDITEEQKVKGDVSSEAFQNVHGSRENKEFQFLGQEMGKISCK